jgi:hypothetical protein
MLSHQTTLCTHRCSFPHILLAANRLSSCDRCHDWHCCWCDRCHDWHCFWCDRCHDGYCGWCDRCDHWCWRRDRCCKDSLST